MRHLTIAGVLATVGAATVLISACSSSSSSGNGGSSSRSADGRPAGADKTKITSWTDPRPAAWSKQFPLFAPVKPGDGSLARVQQAGVVKICAETDIKPYVYADTNGNVVGAEVDMAKWMADYLGIAKVTYVNIPFASLIPALQAGKCDMVMSSISLNATRAAAPGIKYTVPYYWTAYDYLTVRKDSGISSFGDLKGKSIGTLTGSTDAKTAQAQIDSIGGGVDLHQYPNVSLCFLATKNKTVAGCFIDAATTVYGVKQYSDLTKLPTKYGYKSDDPATEDATNPYVYAAVSTITSKGAGDLNLAMSLALNALRTSGQEQTIATKWDLGDVINPPKDASYNFLRGQA